MNRPNIGFIPLLICVGLWHCTPSAKSDTPEAAYLKPNLDSVSVPAERVVDSLVNRVNSLPDNAAKLDAIYNLSVQLREIDTTASRAYANYLLWLADELNSGKGIAQGNYLLGRLAMDRNEVEAAIELFKKGGTIAANSDYSWGKLECYYWAARGSRRVANYSEYSEYLGYLMEEATLVNDKKYLSYAFEGYGNLYRYLGDYAQSLKYYQKAIELADETGDLEEKSTALNNMSLVYGDRGDNGRSLQVQLENYNTIKAMKNQQNLVLCLSNLSATSDDMGDREQAWKYIRESIKVLDELGAGNVSEKDVSSALSQYAYLLCESQKTDSALYYYSRALAISEQIKDRKTVSQLFGNMGAVYEKTGRGDSAEYYYLRKLEITRDIGYPRGEIGALDALAELNFKAGNTELAYEFRKQGEMLMDSLLILSNVSHAAEMDTWHQIKEQQQQIQVLSHEAELQNVELQRKGTLIYAFGTGLLLVLLLAIVVYRNYRQKRLANVKLEEKVKQRTRALSRRNADLKNFIYRSSHDLRAPIVSIKGLLNIARIESHASGATLSYLEKIESVIDKQDQTLMALLRISHLIEGKTNPVRINLSEIFHEVIELYTTVGQSSDIDITADVDPGLSLVTDREALSSILQNLLSNGIKYRRKRSQERSHVRLHARKTSDGIVIKVSDNGEGIPEEWQEKVFDLFSRGSFTADGSGLGLYIVKNCVELLGGTLQLESTFGKGSCFAISLPLTLRTNRVAESGKSDLTLIDL